MATQSAGQIFSSHTPAYISQPLPPIDETAIFYSGQDFTPLNSATITRVTSMLPELSLKAELSLKKDSSNQNSRSSKTGDRESAFARRHRAFSAPEKGVDLGLLIKKLEKDVITTSVDACETRVDEVVTHRPTAQEWTADIDCVSDIFGAMVADGDRGGIHL